MRVRIAERAGTTPSGQLLFIAITHASSAGSFLAKQLEDGRGPALATVASTSCIRRPGRRSVEMAVSPSAGKDRPITGDDLSTRRILAVLRARVSSYRAPPPNVAQSRGDRAGAGAAPAAGEHRRPQRGPRRPRRWQASGHASLRRSAALDLADFVGELERMIVPGRIAAGRVMRPSIATSPIPLIGERRFGNQLRRLVAVSAGVTAVAHRVRVASWSSRTEERAGAGDLDLHEIR